MQVQSVPSAQPMQGQPMQAAQQMPPAQPMPGTQPMPVEQQIPGAQAMPPAQPMSGEQPMSGALPMSGAQPVPPAQPMQVPYAPGAAVVTRRGLPVAAIVAGIVVVVAAAIVAAGLFTNWFGLMGKPVYVLTKATHYDEDGVMKSVSKLQLDARGNTVKEEDTDYYSDDTWTSVSEYEYDDDGFPLKRKSIAGFDDSEKQETVSECQCRLDNRGRLAELRVKSDSTTSTATYKYHDNGVVKSRTNEYESKTEGVTTYESTSDYEYDEGGYLVSISGKSDYTSSTDSKYNSKTSSNYEATWEFDSPGIPSGYELSVKYIDNSDKRTGSYEYEVELDAHGNITAVYDDKGTLVAEYEYERVNNPSEYARMQASIKPYVTRTPQSS